MKIRRPSAPEVPFKRKRSPPPQATKLLTYSLAAGIVFMVLLAIVFLPRMFPDQTPIEIVRGFHFETPNNRTLIYVDSVTGSLDRNVRGTPIGQGFESLQARSLAGSRNRPSTIPTSFASRVEGYIYCMDTYSGYHGASRKSPPA